MLRIHLFGRLARLMDASVLTLPYVPTVGGLRTSLLDEYPALRNQAFQIAVDQEVCGEEASIAPDAEIALLPPYSGG